ncbi:hypothetical protein CYLTODRAFT_411858 [Cylindrobasidium torrendii FP15055 ss-10]|uniref:Uncharacterized protein n=1 Tax=Cylindrobasidium torrendii FP15055 ss-10 TaxID=1314674 RepID=A0A0D7B7H0_9AGAR|nr:hypothetical protein CYLTODRAFT_411858 [Cylindrobasidium torrendii FP15055 ss-10]
MVKRRAEFIEDNRECKHIKSTSEPTHRGDDVLPAPPAGPTTVSSLEPAPVASSSKRKLEELTFVSETFPSTAAPARLDDGDRPLITDESFVAEDPAPETSTRRGSSPLRHELTVEELLDAEEDDDESSCTSYRSPSPTPCPPKIRDPNMWKQACQYRVGHLFADYGKGVIRELEESEEEYPPSLVFTAQTASAKSLSWPPPRLSSIRSPDISSIAPAIAYFKGTPADYRRNAVWAGYARDCYPLQTLQRRSPPPQHFQAAEPQMFQSYTLPQGNPYQSCAGQEYSFPPSDPYCCAPPTTYELSPGPDPTISPMSMDTVTQIDYGYTSQECLQAPQDAYQAQATSPEGHGAPSPEAYDPYAAQQPQPNSYEQQMLFQYLDDCLDILAHTPIAPAQPPTPDYDWNMLEGQSFTELLNVA